MRLEVRQQLKGDIYRDIVRIPAEHRRDTQGRIVREGTVSSSFSGRAHVVGTSRSWETVACLLFGALLMAMVALMVETHQRSPYSTTIASACSYF